MWGVWVGLTRVCVGVGRGGGVDGGRGGAVDGVCGGVCVCVCDKP